jgi:hypothetical protein
MINLIINHIHTLISKIQLLSFTLAVYYSANTSVFYFYVVNEGNIIKGLYIIVII